MSRASSPWLSSRRRKRKRPSGFETDGISSGEAFDRLLKPKESRIGLSERQFSDGLSC
ncbi:hypothetical protein AGR6A_Cc140019 [Agrobacterium sp. NCPPB 925]|nr:hypothetical protein AGR6A_Cc140019 [Agrobacterium sp. NCPPB 925]